MGLAQDAASTLPPIPAPLNMPAPGPTNDAVCEFLHDKIRAITRFGDNSLFPHFGLPRTLPH